MCTPLCTALVGMHDSTQLRVKDARLCTEKRVSCWQCLSVMISASREACLVEVTQARRLTFASNKSWWPMRDHNSDMAVVVKDHNETLLRRETCLPAVWLHCYRART
ncbi:hypothetical protein ABBQ38_007758 [Trebouxia sp. C0009 RCD-2024]